MVNVICAWCKRDLGQAIGFGPTDNRTSHGICENCDRRENVELREALTTVADHVLVDRFEALLKAIRVGNPNGVGTRPGPIFREVNAIDRMDRAREQADKRAAERAAKRRTFPKL